jgi:carboxypeptidase Taq
VAAAGTGPGADELRRRLGEVEDLRVALRLLHYDQQTLMPPAATHARAEAIATTSRMVHELQIAPELLELLDAADHDDPLVRVSRRDADKALRVPADLVAETARAAAEGQEAWELARERDDFADFLPYLERNLELRRQYAACFADEIDEPYDALLDDFEPGMRTEEVRAAFAPLREELPALVAAAAERPAPELLGPFPVEGQRRAVRSVLEHIGFDDRSWLLADSAHPFSSTIGRGDNRITTRYDERTLESIVGVVHEFGHGLYEAQIAPELARTPLAHGCSMAVHESQSRLWEVFVCGGLPFWRGAWDLVAGPLGGALDGVRPEELVAAIRAVRPTLIRVEADPVSYPLHIVLRFDLELALLSGDLAPADLPGAWRDGMRRLLGIEVPDDRRGVLQDVHWAAGAFGYFPTYALGTVLAAQLWEAARESLPGLDETIEAGDFEPLREWLRDRIHRYGRTYEPSDLIRLALGRDLDPAPYLAFARDRAAARSE